jgi:KDO2-lipid IV(A) lauroyltransferase
MIGYLLYALVSFCTNLVSRSLGNWIACRVADCHYFFNKRSREGARANLRVILGPNASAEYRQYSLRWTFRSFGKYFFEFLNNRRFNARFFNRCVTFMGVEHVEAALEAGNGALLASAHLGNWELGAAAMSFRGTPVLSVIQKHPNPRIHDFYMRKREHRNYKVVHVGEAARPILRHLKDNGLVAVLADRPYGEEGIRVEFFGHQVPFPEGPARLALAAGAPLIPGFVLRRWDDSFRIFFRPPITAPAELSKEEKVRHMTQEFARILEQLVRENPTQWPTFYPVFEGSGLPEERGF